MTRDIPPGEPAESAGQGWPAIARDGHPMPVLDLKFGPGELAALREEVRACAIQSGFPEDRATEIVLAVHELAANTIVHGGGAGRLRAWKLARSLQYQVDDGDLMRFFERAGQNGVKDLQPGVTNSASVNSLPSEPGHGLSVVRQLADQTQSLSGSQGTSITLTFGLSR